MYIKQFKDMDEPNSYFRQVFRYQLRAKQYGSKRVIMDMYENGDITDNDIKMFKFLYEVKIATKNQILRRFSWMKEELFEKLTENWINQRFMNVFVLSNDQDEDPFQSDALKFYTIDFCTVTLLKFFVSDNDLINWNPRSLLMPWHLIKKRLLSTEFRIAMETKLARQPITYENNLMFIFGRFRLVLDAQIFMNVAKEDDNVLAKPFLQVSYTEEDFEYGDHTRINEALGRYQYWYEKEGWKSNFRDAPIFWILADTFESFKHLQRLIEDIIEVANERSEKFDIPDVPFHEAIRITCKEMFDGNLENCFVKYDLNEKKWLRTNESFLAEKIDVSKIYAKKS